MKTELKKENVKKGDFLELRGFRSADIGEVHQEGNDMFVAFENKILSLVAWDDDLKSVIKNPDYDVIAIKRLSNLEKQFTSPQNKWCASNVADRYEEENVKKEWVKNKTTKRV